MALQFENKVVWITGASSGYGLALAKAFSKAGAKLVLSARNESQLIEISQQLNTAKIVAFDLCDFDSFEDICQRAIAAYGHIDIVIHNGALAQQTSAIDTSNQLARKIMDVDYFSYTELTRYLLPHFIERNSGHIVVISGLIARFTLPLRTTYAAAKAALFGYFGSLRAELINHNIDITMLIPGIMKTEFASKALNIDGNSSETRKLSAGCDVEVVANQSLLAIANKVYESYVGDEAGEKLWHLTYQDPNKAIEVILTRVKQQQKPN